MDKPKPTPELEQQICSWIRSGGFPHVAAECAGVPTAVFERWLRVGSRPRAPRAYRDFAAEVRKAVAQARMRAEIDAYKQDATVWLKSGPGKDNPASPGWSNPVTG